jgi:hypothetical protein
VVVVNIQGAQNEVSIVQVNREDLFSSYPSISPLRVEPAQISPSPPSSPSISPPPSSRPSEPAQTDISPSPLRIEAAQISLPPPPTELTEIYPSPPSTESTEISPLPPVLGWPPTLALNCPDGTPRTAIGSTVGGLVGTAVLVLLVARGLGYTLKFVRS